MGGPSEPIDSASLVLLRGSETTCEVLLGRRPASARFMPGRYVFPGGSLEPADARPSGFEEAWTDPGDPGLDGPTRDGLAAFARAALRETYEETGLLLAARGRPPEPRPGSLEEVPAGLAPDLWRAYAEAGLIPAFGALRLFARAITPPGLPLRFHARFFLAEGALARGGLKGDGELEDIAWVPVRRTADLPLPGVTRRALRRALAWRSGSSGEPAERAITLLS